MRCETAVNFIAESNGCKLGEPKIHVQDVDQEGFYDLCFCVTLWRVSCCTHTHDQCDGLFGAAPGKSES